MILTSLWRNIIRNIFPVLLDLEKYIFLFAAIYILYVYILQSLHPRYITWTEYTTPFDLSTINKCSAKYCWALIFSLIHLFDDSCRDWVWNWWLLIVHLTSILTKGYRANHELYSCVCRWINRVVLLKMIFYVSNKLFDHR